jgi:hypothetical protein
MATVLWIILADLVVAACLIYRYRRELGLTVNGWVDKSKAKAKRAGARPAKGAPGSSTSGKATAGMGRPKG